MNHLVTDYRIGARERHVLWNNFLGGSRRLVGDDEQSHIRGGFDLKNLGGHGSVDTGE